MEKVICEQPSTAKAPDRAMIFVGARNLRIKYQAYISVSWDEAEIA
jgi:hypothetical protein